MVDVYRNGSGGGMRSEGEGGPEGGGEAVGVGERGGGVWGLGGRERKKRNTGTDEGQDMAMDGGGI